MNTNLSYFKRLRVFVRESYGQLTRLIVCNRIMNSRFMLRNAGMFYGLTSSIMGKNLTSWVLNSTFGKVYAGGNTV